MSAGSSSSRSVPAVLAAALLLAPPAAGEIVRLPDGTLLHGEIIAFDESLGVTLRRVDTGGVLRLRWEHLPAEEVRRIKAARGFTGDSVEPYRVNVVHLVLENGTTETGVLVEGGDGDVFRLQRRSGVDAFPRSYVHTVQTGRVDGLEVYTPDALYLRILEEQGTPVSAAEHFGVAVACEGARLYEQAREHYLTAGRLDAAFKPDLIAARTGRIAVKVEEAEESELLEEIRRTLYRKRFDEAHALARSFRERFAGSRQLGELVDLEREIAARRDDAYVGKIVSDYFRNLRRAIEAIARRDDLPLGGAIELLEEDVHADVMARIARAYRMDDEVVASLWARRPLADVRTSGYGTGTFVLGEEHALDFYIAGREGRGEPDEAGAPAAAGANDAGGLEEEIERAARARAAEVAARQAEAAQGEALAAVGDDPDAWWARASFDERSAWLMAYYAEFGGQLQVRRARPANCRLCGATGRIQVSNELGELEFQTCTTCKGLRYERVISFR